jgi:hypothetical protein
MPEHVCAWRCARSTSGSSIGCERLRRRRRSRPSESRWRPSSGRTDYCEPESESSGFPMRRASSRCSSCLLGLGELPEELEGVCVDCFLGPGLRFLAGGRERDHVGAPVVPVSFPLDVAGSFELVDEGDHRASVDAEPLASRWRKQGSVQRAPPHSLLRPVRARALPWAVRLLPGETSSAFGRCGLPTPQWPGRMERGSGRAAAGSPQKERHGTRSRPGRERNDAGERHQHARVLGAGESLVQHHAREQHGHGRI